VIEHKYGRYSEKASLALICVLQTERSQVDEFAYAARAGPPPSWQETYCRILTGMMLMLDVASS